MGCVASSIEKEERVRICKERKIVMKQLLGLRGDFADAQLIYLRALKNTGVTLRQLTETESLELEYAPNNVPLPPSPPPPLPPSPPPPPTFSPDFRNSENSQKAENEQEETIEVSEDDTFMPPPPPVLSSSWDFWDPFGASSPRSEKKSETVELLEEENWADTNTEFEEEVHEESMENAALILLPEKPLRVELGDDTSSMVSWRTKDADLPMVVWRSKKNLAGIMKDLDDYFLKASAVSMNIVIMVDVNSRDSFHGHSLEEKKRKTYNSAKVFNALAWSWSSKSLHVRTATESCGPSEPCRPGAHCITLEKLYAELQKLYKDVKDEEFTRLELEKKSLLLQKQRDEDHDWTKTEKTRISVEALQSDIARLQESITMASSSVSQLIDEELHPQLIAIISGLLSMWRTMYECHQVQNHISQQTSRLTNQQSVDPTTAYHHQAAAQLKTEVTSWYHSFCRLVRFQREYVRSLCKWIQLTDCSSEGSHWSVSSSAVHNLCKEWQLALEKLPDKVASEAIKSFLAAVNSILLQQEEELDLQKKSIKLEKKLERQSHALAEMEMKHEANSSTERSSAVLSPKHPLSIKRAQVEALKKRASDGKAKYLNSVQVTQAMTLNNLSTTLPNVFQSLMGYSSAYAQSLELILGEAKHIDRDESLNQMC